MADLDDVQNLLLSISNLEHRKSEFVKKVEELQASINQTTGGLKRALEAGATTGDQLRDLVIRVHGVDVALEEKYRTFEARLKGKEKQFVMIRYPAKVRERFGGDLLARDSRDETHFRVGILQGEELVLEKSGITLPIKEYLWGVWPESRVYGISAEELCKGDFFEWRFSEDASPSLRAYLSSEALATNIVLGDQAVRGELKRLKNEEFFEEAAKVLNRLVLVPTD